MLTGKQPHCLRALFLLGLLIVTQSVAAVELRVAVAANFAPCLQELAPVFAARTGHEVVPIVGSTGRHHSQILAGAPFDVFLAADIERPELLLSQGLADQESALVYATGQLVLWKAKPRPQDGDDLLAALKDPQIKHLALANPRLAPYGLAARQTLDHLDLASFFQGRIVLGSSVGQAWQYAASGAADAALMSRSLVHDIPPEQLICVPEILHDPVQQMAVVLLSSDHLEEGRAFLKFLTSAEARQIIDTHGYSSGRQDQ